MGTTELWNRSKAGDMIARNELVVMYMPLVRQTASLVNRGLPDLIEIDDLISDGTIGLIDAIDKFDPERGFKFETYANIRIKGAILDGLRKLDWVPKKERSSIRELNIARGRLSSLRQREVTDEEVQAYLEWDDEEFRRVVARASELNGGMSSLSIPESTTDLDAVPLVDTIISAFDVPGSSDRMDNVKSSLLSAIESLDEMESAILGLRYYSGLKFSEIGELLEVTESRVSQIHTKLVEKLRSALVR